MSALLPTPLGPVTTVSLFVGQQPTQVFKIGRVCRFADESIAGEDLEALSCAYIEEGIAQFFIEEETLVERSPGLPDRLLLDDDQGGQFIGFGDHEKAVEHAQVWLGIADGEDDQYLVRVGHDHVFCGTIGAGQLAAQS